MYDDEYLIHPQPVTRTRGIALPITLTLVGLGAISIAFLLAARPGSREISPDIFDDDESFDVENFDVVKNKPFIYAICE